MLPKFEDKNWKMPHHSDITLFCWQERTKASIQMWSFLSRFGREGWYHMWKLSVHFLSLWKTLGLLCLPISLTCVLTLASKTPLCRHNHLIWVDLCNSCYNGSFLKKSWHVLSPCISPRRCSDYSSTQCYYPHNVVPSAFFLLWSVPLVPQCFSTLELQLLLGSKFCLSQPFNISG